MGPSDSLLDSLRPTTETFSTDLEGTGYKERRLPTIKASGHGFSSLEEIFLLEETP